MPSASISPVNVASVPQRSVFRYPGGKTWLVPQLRAWLKSQGSPPSLLIEPFCGGGVLGLTAVAEGLVERALLVELDPNVAAVWEVLINGDAEGLAVMIETFDFTEGNVRAALAKECAGVDLAFQTILRNRVQRGGIMAPRAGLLRAGERGRGLSSRWYPETLGRRIRNIMEYRERIAFLHGDGLVIMAQHVGEESTVLFIDPPYTAGGQSAGSRLYRSSELDHELLFDLAHQHRGDFLMTYDNAPEVRALASSQGFGVLPIAMHSNQNGQMRELLIGRDLEWVL